MRASALALVLSLSGSVCALAAEPPQVPPASPNELSALYDKGATAFAEGRYAEAARAFEQAYRMKPAASLLFNIARTYDRLFIVDNDEVALQRAIDAYREYLSERKVPRQREAVERLEALMLIQAKRKPSPPPPAPVAAPQYPTYPPMYQPVPMPVYAPPPRIEPLPPTTRDPYSTPVPVATAAPKPVPPKPAPAPATPPASAEPKKPAPSTPAKKGGESNVKWIPATTFLQGGP